MAPFLPISHRIANCSTFITDGTANKVRKESSLFNRKFRYIPDLKIKDDGSGLGLGLNRNRIT